MEASRHAAAWRRARAAKLALATLATLTFLGGIELVRANVPSHSKRKLQPLAGSIRPAPGSESGWGLYLVDHIASRWGSMPGRYWFQLDVSGRSARN